MNEMINSVQSCSVGLLENKAKHFLCISDNILLAAFPFIYEIGCSSICSYHFQLICMIVRSVLYDSTSSFVRSQFIAIFCFYFMFWLFSKLTFMHVSNVYNTRQPRIIHFDRLTFENDNKKNCKRTYPMVNKLGAYPANNFQRKKILAVFY